jgi:hypothetical protein
MALALGPLGPVERARFTAYGLLLLFWMISAISLDHVYKSL